MGLSIEDKNMNKIIFPYGKERLEYDFSSENFLGTLTSSLSEYRREADGRELVRRALDNPIGSERLSALAAGKKKIVIIASDHTRPVPSKIIIPEMLREIRAGAPDADITILIATGCHRETTREELIAKFGEDIVNNERIVVHDSTDEASLVHIGTLPSGGALRINRLAAECDLLVSEGFIEPHFFAGFSGGRKSVLPGIAAKESVLANHCSEFIAHPLARTGILEGNPIHKDMLWAAKAAGLAFIVNVVINEEKETVYAVAGDCEAAHLSGCEFLLGLCRARAIPSDIVITTNGGYPLDQNAYQAVKGMTAAEQTVNEGGVIIMLARANDGHGGEEFYNQLSREPDVNKTMDVFLARSRGETVPDQWQTQIFLRILMRAAVIFVSEMDDETVRGLHMTPAHSIGEALALAKKMLGKKSPSVLAIPDGVSIIVEKN